METKSTKEAIKSRGKKMNAYLISNFNFNFVFQVKNNLPNFDQFIEFVLDKKRNLHKRPMGDNADPHLNFFWRKCDMCNIEYDVIGKAETSKEDLEFIFSKVG